MSATGRGTRPFLCQPEPASWGDGHLALLHEQFASQMAGKASFACDRHVCLPSSWIFPSTPLSRSLKALVSWLAASHIVPINRMEKKTFSSSVFPSIFIFFFRGAGGASVVMKPSEWVLWAPGLWTIFEHIEDSPFTGAWLWTAPGIEKKALQWGIEPRVPETPLVNLIWCQEGWKSDKTLGGAWQWGCPQTVCSPALPRSPGTLPASTSAFLNRLTYVDLNFPLPFVSGIHIS